MKKKYATFFLLLISTVLIAQENEKEAGEKFEPKHSIGLTIGHEHAFSGRNADGKRETEILPFWGIDYNFQFAPKFVIGLHTDIVVETFEVEKNLEGGTEEVVERTRPIAPALVLFYKPTEHWSFGFGMGAEFAKEENYTLNRLAIEYGCEIRRGWEVFGGLQYDFRWKAYDTWTIGLGISKEIGGKKNNKE